MVNSSEKPPIIKARPVVTSRVLTPVSQVEIERYQPILDEHDRLEAKRLAQLQEEAGREQRERGRRVIAEHDRQIAKLLKENPGFPHSEESEEKD